MFERFADEARQVVVTAQEEARELRAEQIEPVHLLLALAAGGGPGGDMLRKAGVDQGRLRTAVLRSADPLDAEALAALGVDLSQVRAAAEAAFGSGALDRPVTDGHIAFAEGAKQSLEEALRHAVRRKGRRIDSGHLLVGMLAVGDPVVGRVLQQLGVNAGALREQAAGEPP